MAGLDAYALISWEFTKEILPDLRDTDQIRYELLINAASSTANRVADRYLKALDYTSTLDGSGRSSLLLPEYPVNSVSAVRIDTERVFGAESEVTGYLVYATEGKITLISGSFPSSPQCVEVAYNAGFDPVPEDLKLAVLEVVIYNAKRLGGNAGAVGVRSIAGPDGLNTSYELSIPMNARKVFESYRRTA